MFKRENVIISGWYSYSSGMIPKVDTRDWSFWRTIGGVLRYQTLRIGLLCVMWRRITVELLSGIVLWDDICLLWLSILHVWSALHYSWRWRTVVESMDGVETSACHVCWFLVI